MKKTASIVLLLALLCSSNSSAMDDDADLSSSCSFNPRLPVDPIWQDVDLKSSEFRELIRKATCEIKGTKVNRELKFWSAKKRREENKNIYIITGPLRSGTKFELQVSETDTYFMDCIETSLKILPFNP